MRIVPSTLKILAAASLVGVAAHMALAQQGGAGFIGQPTTQPGDRNIARPQWDAAAQEAQMKIYNDWQRNQFGATEEEWQVLKPRLSDLDSAQRVLWGWSSFKADPKDNPKNDPKAVATPAVPKPNEITVALNELKKILEDKNASPDQIKAKITALRTAREQANADIKKAQQALRDLISVRQEAMLISQGKLD